MRYTSFAIIFVALGVAAAGPVRGQDGDLERLGRRIEEIQTANRQAARTATRPEDQEDDYLRHAPENLVLEELFALEEKDRGKPASIAVLHWILSRAMSVGDPGYPIARPRVKVIGLLQEHYHDHADLDLLITGFEAGTHVPEAEALLRRAGASPHRHVRAAALYQLASWLGHEAQNAEEGRQMLALYAKEPEKHRAEIERLERWLKTLGSAGKADQDRARAEAVGLLETIARDYADVSQAMFMVEGPGALKLRRLGPEEAVRGDVRTYGPRAEALRFELTRLGVGQPAPELAGRDVDGREFTLADYQGRVVLLMFSANWCGPCKAMYPDNRKLVETYRGRPFALLGVMADREVDTVLESYAAGDLTWRVWHDGSEGPIATRWNIQSWPTTYVLDHRGIIRFRNLRGDQLATAVAALEEENARDPEAAALLAAHPVAGQPIPSRLRGEIAKRGRATPLLEITPGDRRAESIAFGPGGKLLLTAGWDKYGEGINEFDAWGAGKAKGVLQLWDAEAGTNLGLFEGPCGALFSAAFSPDGTIAATAGRVRDDPKKGEVLLWDVATRRVRTTLGGHDGWVLSAAFSPDGKLLAAGGFEKVVKIWDVGSAAETITLPAQSSSIDRVLFSPDGKTLAAALRNGNVKLWETATWTECATLENRDFFLFDAVFSPDGKKLAVAGAAEANKRPQKGEVRVWDIAARRLDTVIPRNELVSSAAFSPDGRLLALCDMKMTVEVWDLAASGEHALIKRSRASSADEVVFLPQGRGTVVAFTTPPGRVAIWKIAD